MEIKIFITFSVVFVLSFLSCEAQNKNSVEIDIRDCINKIINKPIIEFYRKDSIDFYDTMLEIENQLVQSKLINDTSKASYLKLFYKIENQEKETYAGFYNETIDFLDDRRLYINHYALIDAIFSICPYEILNKVDGYENNRYYKYAVTLNEVTKGLSNQEIIVDLISFINEKEFKQLDYRAPIILLAIINMEYKLHPAEQLEEFEYEGRSIFKRKNKE